MTENSSEKTVKSEKKSWQFQKGQSGNPKGKPKGTRNKATMMAKSLFEQNSEALAKKAIELALNGDLTALKLCLDKIMPNMKSQSRMIEAFIEVDQSSLTDIAKNILTQTIEGNIPPDSASQLISSVALIARTEEMEQIKDRLEALEMAISRK